MIKPVHSSGKGFTLVELLVALLVTSIVLTAVAALAFALGTAKESTDDTSWKQAQLRCVTLRLSDLIKYCKLVCGVPSDDLVVWRADENGDGKINPSELVYIEAGPSRNYLWLLEFPTTSSESILLSDIQSGTAKQTLISLCDERRTVLMPECNNVQFQFDVPPPQSRFVSISFDLTENGVAHRYQISAALCSWAGNLLNESGSAIMSDDD